MRIGIAGAGTIIPEFLNATKLIEEKNREIMLSDFGSIINGYDPYLEDIFSWWLIHINMITNIDDAYIYNLFFNKCNIKTFTKRELYEKLYALLTNEKLTFNENILQDEVNMIIKTYTIDEKIDNPENNFICPFSTLILLATCTLLVKPISESPSVVHSTLNPCALAKISICLSLSLPQNHSSCFPSGDLLPKTSLPCGGSKINTIFFIYLLLLKINKLLNPSGFFFFCIVFSSGSNQYPPIVSIISIYIFKIICYVYKQYYSSSFFLNFSATSPTILGKAPAKIKVPTLVITSG